MVNVEQGLRVLSILIGLQIGLSFVVLVGEPRSIQVRSLWVEFVPECEFLIDGLVECRVPSDLREIPNQIQNALERDVIPIHIFEQLN